MESSASICFILVPYHTGIPDSCWYRSQIYSRKQARKTTTGHEQSSDNSEIYPVDDFEGYIVCSFEIIRQIANVVAVEAWVGPNCPLRQLQH